jgi:hypothetical protein
MPYVIGEVEVTNEITLAPNAVIYDGAIVEDGDLSVKVNGFYYNLDGAYGRYVGSSANAVTDDTTNYIYLDISGVLTINTTGYPVGSYIQLGRVVASGGFILRIFLERPLLSVSLPTGGFVPSTRTLTAGGGLTGGGDLSADRSFDIVANADGSIVVNSNDIQVGILASDTQHGSRGGGTQHSAVTTSVNGFMSSTDKTKLDGISSGAAALTSSAPADVTKSTAAVGVGTTAARSDHKHDVSTATAGAATPGDSVAEGTATSLSRSDHQHSLPSFGSASGTFCQGNDSRLSDDRVASGLRTTTTVVVVSAAAAPSAGQVLTASSGTSANWVDPLDLATTTPADVTKAAAVTGVDTTAARADHKHNVSTASPATTAVVIGNSISEGTATSLARSDHQHTVSGGTPVAVGTTNSDGTATTFSRSDHIHNHGSQTTGTHHAVATGLVNGFMLSTDKSKLDLMDPDFGRNYTLAQSLGTSTTTSTTFQTKVTLVTGALTGVYLLTWYCIMSRPSGGNPISARLYNVTSSNVVGGSWSKDQLQITDRLQFSGAAVITLSGTSNSFALQYAGGGINTAAIGEARIEMWRVSA